MTAKLPLVSASQIGTFLDCERKWGWSYIAGVKSPGTKATELGTEVDDTQLQPYLRDGRPLDYTRESAFIAETSLPLLPEPKTLDLEVQKHFIFPAASGVFGYQGFVDVWLPRGEVPQGDPCVIDFKTTGNWAYAKTADDLTKDPQAIIYAKWALTSTGAQAVDLAWTYMGTKKPYRAKRVHLRLTQADIEAPFASINETAERMYTLRKTVRDPKELPPNTNACSKYGGCYYRDMCGLNHSQEIDAIEGPAAPGRIGTMSEVPLRGLAALAARRAKEIGEAPAPVAALPKTLEPEPLGINPPESKLEPLPEPVVAPKATRPGLKKTKAEPLRDATPVTGETVTVTWSSDSVGPFSATSYVLEGETPADACLRLYDSISAFGESVVKRQAS